jgi:hypothetical protein
MSTAKDIELRFAHASEADVVRRLAELDSAPDWCSACDPPEDTHTSAIVVDAGAFRGQPGYSSLRHVRGSSG